MRDGTARSAFLRAVLLQKVLRDIPNIVIKEMVVGIDSEGNPEPLGDPKV